MTKREVRAACPHDGPDTCATRVGSGAGCKKFSRDGGTLSEAAPAAA